MPTELGKSFGVQDAWDVLRFPRMGPRVAANLVEDPLLPTVRVVLSGDG